MRYSVKGKVVRSENAARSASQAAAKVLQWISTIPPDWKVLDYGCGKLRYTLPLAKQVREVVAVDSEVQISRVQRILGESTTVKDFVSQRLVNTTAYPASSIHWRSMLYDAVLLLNVLSAIPVIAERHRILGELREVLRPDGRLFVCTQYRNSYFKTWEGNPRAVPHLDGWLVKNRFNSRVASFYGLIRPSALASLCEQNGFEILERVTRNGSVYIIAEPGST